LVAGAMELPTEGRGHILTATAISNPSSLACTSVRPTAPTSGSVKVTLGSDR
jgi:hypothetical protein